jgi:putative inorganic carbon (hco3(-)) transporter
MPLRALFLLIFVVCSVPVCFVRPFYGILLWTIVAFLNPQGFTWDAFDAFPWASAVAIPTILGMLIFDRHLGRFRSPLPLVLGLLWMWFTITTWVSMGTPELAHHAAETWERWKFVSKILLMTACTICVVNSFERLRYLTLTIASCFGFYVLKSIPFLMATGGTFRLYGPERSMIGENNGFGLALNMTLPLFFYLAHMESRRWVRRSLALLFVLTIPVIFFTYSRGALLGLVAVLSLMLLQSRRRLTLLPVIAFSAALAVFLAPDAWRQRMDPTRPGAIDASANSRLDAWAYSLALASDYPITGGGFATFTEELYTRYWPGDIVTVYGPHSVYFQVLAEHGFVGFGLYMLLVLSGLYATWRIHRISQQKGDTQTAYYAHMFLFSMVGFLVSGMFLGLAYFDYFFTIVACVIALRQLSRDRWTENVSKPLTDLPAFSPRVSRPATVCT